MNEPKGYGERRAVARVRKAGLSTQDLILIAVLLAAGAVLKLTLGSVLTFAGTKPNFIIAMYCLAIVLARPRPLQALVVGVIAGLICQLPMMNATPWLNIPSEALGALVMGVAICLPLRFGRVDLAPALGAFVSTVVSGYTFVLLLAALNGISLPVAVVTYAVMVFGTAVFNTVLVQILIIPLRKVLKRQDDEGAAAGSAAQRAQMKGAGAGAAFAADASAAADAVAVADASAVGECANAPLAVEMKDFTFRYREGDEPVVRNVNLTIPAGSFVGITGAAGSGKSTLTYAMNGIIPHCYPGDFYGMVRVCGLDTVETDLTDVSGLVGSVCQDIDSQMVSSVVEDEMLYGLENFGVPRDQIEQRVVESLEAMGISHLRDRVIASLSGGQKQKVAIASILALRPRVLVLDEPTAELDPASSVAVFDLLKKHAREHGITVVVVEQKIALLSDYADLLVIMDDGQVVYADAPAEVLQHSEHLLEIGVNCPRSTSLANRLRSEGLYAGPVCRNVDEAVAVMNEVLA